MKIKLCGLVALVMMIAFCSSCQKEVDDSFFTQNPEDTVLLKSVIYLDTTKPSGSDTVYKTEFVYDNSKRVISNFAVEFYSPTSSTSFSYNFIYTGNNKIPLTVTITQSGITGSMTVFPTYNGSSFVIKDSNVWSFSPTDVTIEKYSTTPSGGFVYVLKQKDLTTGTIIDRDSTLYRRTISAGNIISGTDSTYHPTLGFSLVNYAYAYDAKVNPFGSISSIYPYLGAYFFTGDSYILPIGKNNATSFLEAETGGTSVSGTISYTYRSDDYPLTGKITGYADANKIIFSYY